MNEKEFLVQQKKKTKFALGNWLKNNTWHLLLISSLLYFLISWNWSGRQKFFSLQKEEKTGKIIISGLEEKDRLNLDLDKKVRYTSHTLGLNEYSITGKNKELWDKFQPTDYYTLSEIKPEEIDQACREGKFVLNKENEESKVELIISEGQSFLASHKKNLFPRIEKFLPWLLVFLIIDIFSGMRITKGIVSFFRMQRQRIKTFNPPRISFKDIGGLHEAKEELQEIVAYFRNPQDFWDRGAFIPKGILLVGQPGNGKTLLAKALAGECKLPFIYRSAPELEKGIVGWGAAEVRNLFALARQHAQEKGGCFLFVDEIDAIAGKRNQSMNSHHETLNQLLSELDGFHSRDNIVFLAATNSLKSLDPAILRPGRFDRHILISPPGYQGRREIITLCLEKKPIVKDLDLEELVAMTEGLSGAQIVNVFNEAIILSLRYRRDYIDQEIIFEAFDRTLMGPSLKKYNISPQTELFIAYHESGHALLGLILPEISVKKITIVPRWTAGGYTWITLNKQQKEDNHLVNKREILAQVTSLLGGRASEEVVYGKELITIGAYSDFKKASFLVRDLVLRYGMSELGIVMTQDSPFFGEENLNELSEDAKQKIEKESARILNECWQKAKKIIQGERIILDLLAKALVKKNTLQKEEINYIFFNRRPLDQFLLN